MYKAVDKMRVEISERYTIFGFKKAFVVQRFNTKVSNDGTSAATKGCALGQIIFRTTPTRSLYRCLDFFLYLILLVTPKRLEDTVQSCDFKKSLACIFQKEHFLLLNFSLKTLLARKNITCKFFFRFNILSRLKIRSEAKYLEVLYCGIRSRASNLKFIFFVNTLMEETVIIVYNKTEASCLTMILETTRLDPILNVWSKDDAAI